MTALLFPRHAQHVVLIHFPIALFVAGVAFDLVGRWLGRPVLATIAYYNLRAAAWSTLPALATGLLAWRFQLEGQTLKGTLLRHLVLACVSSATILLVAWMHGRRRRFAGPPPALRAAIEIAGVALVAWTAHLGGILSGVDVGG